MRGSFRFVLAVALTLSVVAVSTVQAEQRKMNQRQTGALAATPVTNSPDFGTQDYAVEQVISFGFGSANPFGDSAADNGNAYRWFTAGSDDFYWVAPLHLPAGVIIDYIGLDYCDTDPTLTYQFTAYKSFGDSQFDTIGSITPPAAQTGCGYVYNTVALNYLYDSNYGNLLSLYVFQPSTVTDGTIKFRGAEVWYRRVVSPAPGTASFLDVPTSDPFFQYIEALKASGITGGCGDGTNFCPDQPVLRKQMATFIAKALGLSWQY